MCSRVLWIDHGKQKKFDKCDLVCDLYMDEKRKAMNMGVSAGASDEVIAAEISGDGAVFPEVHYKSSKLQSCLLYTSTLFFHGKTTAVFL